jgi:hypothetical protein
LFSPGSALRGLIRGSLEIENNKLKRILAEKLLEVEALKDVISKKW